MKAIYVVTCDFALISQDAKATIVGVFNTIRGPAVPIVWPRFALAARLEFDPLAAIGSHHIEMMAKSPKGAILGRIDGTLNFGPPPVPTKRANFDPHMMFDNFVFAEFGTYSFSVTIDGITLATAEIDVVQHVPA